MPFVANFPFFCILLTMASGVVSSILNGKNAYRLNLLAISACLFMSSSLLLYMIFNPQSITYMMGHFPAPWGNELKFGPLEALIATVFCFVMLVSLIAGKSDIFSNVKSSKLNLFYLMINLLLSSLLALVYTNDLFTAYVFLELNTLTACAVVMAKESGKTISATIRYLIMSLLGSGLFLISIILLYDLTGHLLMPNINESLTVLMQNGTYLLPITIIIGLLAVSMAIKSALFPFHTWLPNAYNSALNVSNSISSGVILKVYTILLIKVFLRVIGIENLMILKVTNVLFVFGVLGMIAGSIDAMREKKIKRMVAYSSVAQMGYIYLGIGLGTQAGFIVAVFHIIVHAITKPMLFSAVNGLSNASDDAKYIDQLDGAAYRNPLAGVAFVIGSLSMIGIPMFAGFATKYYLAGAALQAGNGMWIVLIALALSTVLNAIYYIRVIITIYHKNENNLVKIKNENSYKVGMVLFITANLLLGLFYQPVVNVIISGLQLI